MAIAVLRKGLVFGIATCLVLGAECAECRWIGGDGKWSNTANWQDGQRPGSGDVAVFGSNVRVEVNNSYTIGGLIVESGNLELGGASKLAISEKGNIQVKDGAHLMIDGPTVRPDNNAKAEIGVGASLEVHDGVLSFRYGNLTVNTNAQVAVSGGTLTFENSSLYVILAKNAKIKLTDGSFDLPRLSNKVNTKVPSDFEAEESTIDIYGGSFRILSKDSLGVSFYAGKNTAWRFFGDMLTFPSRICKDLPGSAAFFPPKDKTLFLNGSGLVFQADELTNDVYWIGGTVCATNDASAGYVNISYANDNDLKGGGDLYLPQLTIHGANTDVDLSGVYLARLFSSGAKTGGTLHFNDGITIGTWGDVTVDEDTSRKGAYFADGPIRFDTLDCFDKATTHRINLFRRFDFSDVTAVEAVGGGQVDLVSSGTFGSGLKKLEVAKGTMLSLDPLKSEAVVADRLTMGSGSVLSLGTKVLDVAVSFAVDAGAEIRFSFGGLENGQMYPLWFGPQGTEPPVSNFVFDPPLPSGWQVVTKGPTAYLGDGTVVGLTEAQLGTRCYWKGVNGGLWNDEENWTLNGEKPYVPGGNISAYAYFAGNKQLSVTNDFPTKCWLRNLIAQPGAGPYTISGNPIYPVYPASWGISSASVQNSSAFPFVVENQLLKGVYKDYTPESFFYATANTDAPLVMTGGGNLTNAVFAFRGDVRVGGKWGAIGLYPYGTGGRASRLTILPGADFSVFDQGSNQTIKACYNVCNGAVMTVAGQCWSWSKKENVHFVDGELNVSCPMQTTARQTFRGAGAIKATCFQSDAEGAGAFKFADAVTVRPASWITVREGADNPLRMIVRDNVTIGAKADWTYGPQPDFTTATVAADRALTIEGGAKSHVTFDTEGHVITLADPIVAEKWSTVVKAGAGSLVLAASGNGLEDADLELKAGSVAIDAAQTFRKVKFSGGTIELSGALKTAAESGFVPVLSVREFDGDIAFDGEMRFKLRTAADNRIEILARERKGLLLLFR